MSTVLQERIEQIQHLAELVKKQQADVKAAADLLRVDFETYISDQSVPLDTRWAFWTNAPVELKNDKPWVQHFNFNGKKISWFDSPTYSDKYVLIRMGEVVEAFEDLDPDDGAFGLDDEENKAEAIVALKEDILKTNVYSFTNDW